MLKNEGRWPMGVSRWRHLPKHDARVVPVDVALLGIEIACRERCKRPGVPAT